jgi:hypothetical protein
MEASPPATPRARLVLVEALVMAAVVAATYHDLHDPARVLAWFFGELPSRTPRFLPWLALVRGVGNLMLLGVLATVLVRHRAAEWLRRAATAWFVVALVVVPVLAQIELRLHIDEAPGNEAPYRSGTHDGGVLQTEMAVDELLAGRDPYRADYGRPPMSRSRDSDENGWRSFGYAHNPAFDHLPYLPGVLIVSAPAQAVSRAIFHAWDERFLYLAAALGLAAVLGSMVPAGPARRSVWLVTLASPLLLGYLVVGRNDVLVLLPLALFARALLGERWRDAAIWLGVALAMKQFAIFALPFFAIVLHRRGKLRELWPALAIPAAVILPFLLWDARAFVADVLVWNLGGGRDAYPVRWDGYGLSPIAYGLGLVDSPSGPNPLGWLSLPAILAALAALLGWILRDPAERATPVVALIASGVLLFVALATSRFFADNYLAVPFLLIAVAVIPATRAPPPPAPPPPS